MSWVSFCREIKMRVMIIGVGIGVGIAIDPKNTGTILDSET